MNQDRLIDEAQGYARLGMLAEAEAVLEQVPRAQEKAYLTAQNYLLGIYLCRRECQKAADAGRLLILQGLFDVDIVTSTMMALTFIGRHEEGRDVLALVERFGRPLSDHAYQMACFESLLENFPDSLRWLETELLEPRYFSDRSIGDSDLFPLWRWLATNRPSSKDAHRILQMNLGKACDAACKPNAEIRLDHNDLKGVPARAQDLFRFNFAVGMFELNPSAVAKNPVSTMEFRNSRARHIAKIVAMIRAGIHHAQRIVIQLQPKYAAEHAAWNNHLGARYHILWTLARKPEMLRFFYAQPGLRPMYGFLDGVVDVQMSDSGFVPRMDLVRDLVSADLEEAWKTLEQTPPSVRKHPLFCLRQAMLYQADNDHERALPLYLKLCSTWPDDAVGFANACNSLMKLGRWIDAEKVFRMAPKCYEQFLLHNYQRQSLCKRTLDNPTYKTVSFRGQPDLGGLLSSPLVKCQSN